MTFNITIILTEYLERGGKIENIDWKQAHYSPLPNVDILKCTLIHSNAMYIYVYDKITNTNIRRLTSTNMVSINVEGYICLHKKYLIHNKK